MKKALTVGINNYGGANNLNGCLNDAATWGSLLQSYGFQIQSLTDQAATPQAVARELRNLLGSASAGDIVVFTYSGHGTTVPDTNGDEIDSRDEALYLFGGVLTDDQMRMIFDNTPAGVKVTAIMDCCHSGNITRAIPGEDAPKIRYLPYRGEEVPEDVVVEDLPTKGRILGNAEDGMVEVLITGCRDSEFSYDARFNGQPFGAMTYYAVEILKANANLTYEQFFAQLRQKLPSGQYPQTPQLEGRIAARNQPVFS
jgi:hypothetical protein